LNRGIEALSVHGGRFDSAGSGPFGKVGDFLLSKRVAFVQPLICDKEFVAGINVCHGDLPLAVLSEDGPIAGAPVQESDDCARLEAIGEPVGVLAMVDSDQVAGLRQLCGPAQRKGLDRPGGRSESADSCWTSLVVCRI
jgi:hypothetical protein